MDPKSDQYGTTKSPGRRIFKILERSGRRCFFDVFGDQKKSAQNLEKSGKKPARGAKTTKIARPGGMREASGEVRRGLEPLRVRQESQEFKT